jgi:hypothetical protein
MQAAATLASEPANGYIQAIQGYQPQTPPLGPVQMQWDGQWQWPQSVQPVEQTVPPISQMLMREAEAWRALLQLHGSVLNLTRGLASVTTDDGPVFDEPREASDQREASYIAGLSQLCSHCDLLVAEATKIRGLRKAKSQAETQALKEILRTHADEALGMGDVLARNGAMQIASVTSELRQSAQVMRTQVQQARALMAAATEWHMTMASAANAPPGLELVMGFRTGERVEIRPVAQVLEHVYQRGQLNDDNLLAALVDGPAPEPEAPAQRTFSRRSAGRQLRQEIVSAVSSDV